MEFYLNFKMPFAKGCLKVGIMDSKGKTRTKLVIN